MLDIHRVFADEVRDVTGGIPIGVKLSNEFCIDDLTTWNREMAHLSGIAYGGVVLD